jgi:hypothetical protein
VQVLAQPLPDLLQLGCHPLADVFRYAWKYPVLWFFPQMWVKSGKLKVSGFPGL